MYTLDTNTLIYFFKGMGNVSKNFFSKPPQEIIIPAIVLYELEVGIAKSTQPEKRALQLRALTSRVAIIPFGTKEAKLSAKIRSELESRGLPIGPYDLLIAGTALSTNSILVTHNTKEFQRVNNLEIEDWF